MAGAFLAACQAAPVDTADAALAFERIEFRGQSFAVVTVDITRADLRLHWKDHEGKNLVTFGQLKSWLDADGMTLRFACNAGIFTPQFEPAGLYIENREALRALNQREGPGNFHLMPNGVFYIEEGSARVVTTEAYAESSPQPTYAVQSGPLLVISGEIHPAFQEGSANLRVRNGVGVADSHRVVFALSETPVNFYDFAVLFREVLGCSNALYLDGELSMFYAPELEKQSEAGLYAGMFAVVEPKPDSQDKETP